MCNKLFSTNGINLLKQKNFICHKALPCPHKQNFHGEVAAFHVNTVDSTGAGDSFVGALLSKIVDDQSILEVRTHTLTQFNNFDFQFTKSS